jgi:phosphate-selective porin OprO and OprP
MPRKRYAYTALLATISFSMYIESVVCMAFAREVAQYREASPDKIDDLKYQLKLMEEVFSKQQEQMKQMQELALKQQEQIQALKDRIESLPAKEEVKQEVENYLSSDEVREKMGHSLSAVTPAYTPDHEKYSLGFSTADDRYSLHLGFGLHFRYTFTDEDKDFGGEDTSTIDVRRARIYFGGNIYSKLLHYYVAFDADRAKDVNLRDFYVYWTPMKELHAKIGFFKVPFNRQRLASSFKFILIERSIASEFFDQDRDYGIDIYGLPFDGHMEYHAAVFNGAGETADANIDNKLMYVLSVRYNPFGKYDYLDETDFTYSETLKATIGAAVVFNPKLRDEPSEETGIVGTVDFGIKYRGISWNNEYYIMSQDPEDNGDSIKSDGFFTQIGYFVLPKRLELATRYSLFDPDKDIPNDIQREYTIGLNYYFRAHRSKLQTDFSHLITENNGQDEKENIFRLQYQIIF